MPTPQQERRRRLRAMSLTERGRQFHTDKAGLHHDTEHYERHLRHLKEEAFTLLEIGVGVYRRERKGGASLKMWKHFFPNAEIIGLDIEDKSWLNRRRTTVVQGSQTGEELVTRVVREAGGVRVLIDDGSHRPEHIRETFPFLFPLLDVGGSYCIEDIQTSYWPEWGGAEDRHDPTITMALVKDLVDGLNYEELAVDGCQPNCTDLNIVAVHCDHKLMILEKGRSEEGTNQQAVLSGRYPT